MNNELQNWKVEKWIEKNGKLAERRYVQQTKGKEKKRKKVNKLICVIIRQRINEQKKNERNKQRKIPNKKRK
jgi:hypothetical protein